MFASKAASRSTGAILIFVFYVVFKRFGFLAVAISGGVLPCLAFLGTLCLQESPIFEQRYLDCIIFTLFHSDFD